MNVEIVDWNDDGRGRGRLAGRVALVSQAHPGEEVVFRPDRTTRGTLQGRVARVVKRDPRRRSHACRHEFHCTGCPFLALAVEDEARFKHDRVRRVLAAVGVDVEPDAVRTPTEPFGYRHLAKQSFGRRRGRVFLGSRVAGTDRLTDNAGCPVLVGPLARVMEEIARTAEVLGLPISTRESGPGLLHVVARHSRSRGQQLLTLVSDEPGATSAVALGRELATTCATLAGVHAIANRSAGNVLLAGDLQRIAGSEALEEELLGYRHLIGPRAFFQVSPVAAAELFGVALDLAGTGASCVEGFAGVGALTLPLAERFGRVAAVESEGSSAASLEAATRRHGVTNVEVVTAPVEEVLARLLLSVQPEVVVLDPPRRGLGAALASHLGAGAASRIVLLSCEPATLERDLPPLIAHGFRVERVVPVDQFPRTAHVETVTLLVR